MHFAEIVGAMLAVEAKNSDFFAAKVAFYDSFLTLFLGFFLLNGNLTFFLTFFFGEFFVKFGHIDGSFCSF